MKKFLFSLLGTALLFQFVYAANNLPKQKRDIDVYIEEVVLFSTSDSYSGTITKVEVFTLDWQLLLTQEYNNVYDCTTDVSSLGVGNYIVKVTTSNSYYAKRFKIY